jgi:hypothetical protein
MAHRPIPECRSMTDFFWAGCDLTHCAALRLAAEMRGRLKPRGRYGRVSSILAFELSGVSIGVKYCPRRLPSVAKRADDGLRLAPPRKRIRVPLRRLRPAAECFGHAFDSLAAIAVGKPDKQKNWVCRRNTQPDIPRNLTFRD